MVRFTSKNVKRDKSFISFIYFLYALLAFKLILSICVANILHCSLPETGHGMAVVRNPGRDMRVLFFHLFRRLSMLFERLNILFAQLIILFEQHN